MAAIEEGGRYAPWAAQRQYYGARLRRLMSRFIVPAAGSGMMQPASRKDVIECYRVILGREPENAIAADAHLAGRPLVRDLISNFSQSAELRGRHLRTNLVLDRARQPDYLARSLDWTQRLQVYFNHYGYLLERFTDSTIHELISCHETLHELNVGGAAYRILLTATHERHEEGELQLQLQLDCVALYVMGITIVPGAAFGLPDRHAVLISRMQGVPRAFQEIRKATKDFGEIHPKAALLAALQGVMQAVGMTTILGVAATNQVAFDKSPADALEKTYDDFFAAAGGQRWGEHFFLLASDRERPTSAALSRSHAKRAERKRRLKDEISASAADHAQRWLRPPRLTGADVDQDDAGQDPRAAPQGGPEVLSA
jgi:uncharacterized protein VirK/YbjX